MGGSLDQRHVTTPLQRCGRKASSLVCRSQKEESDPSLSRKAAQRSWNHPCVNTGKRSSNEPWAHTRWEQEDRPTRNRHWTACEQWPGTQARQKCATARERTRKLVAGNSQGRDPKTLERKSQGGGARVYHRPRIKMGGKVKSASHRRSARSRNRKQEEVKASRRDGVTRKRGRKKGGGNK